MKLKNTIRNFNLWVASKSAQILTSMTFFWILNLIILLPLFLSHPTSLIAWISFFISTWFQGVSLIILSFVSKIEGDKTRRLLTEELKILKEILKETKRE